MQRTVDAGREPGRRDDAPVVNPALVVDHLDLRKLGPHRRDVLGGRGAARPSSRPALARMKAPLHTDIVIFVFWFAPLTQFSVPASLRAARTPPPGTTR